MWRRLSRGAFDTESLKTPVHGFITSSGVDYCNAVLAGAPRNLLLISYSAYWRPAQIGLTAGLSRLLHNDLHWFDVLERVQYKLVVIAFRCFCHTAPQYLLHCTHWPLTLPVVGVYVLPVSNSRPYHATAGFRLKNPFLKNPTHCFFGFYWILVYWVFGFFFYLNEQSGSLLVDLAHQLSFYWDSPLL